MIRINTPRPPATPLKRGFHNSLSPSYLKRQGQKEMYIPKERKLRTIKEAGGLRGKPVLVRVDDLNTPLQFSPSKGENKLVTIRYLIRKRARVIIICNSSKKRYEFLKGEIKEKVNIFYFDKLLGPQVLKKINQLKNGDILVCGNLNDYIGEKMNSPKFARELARLGDMYVNDAPGVSRKLLTSVSLLPRLLPSYAGSNLKKLVRVKSQGHILKNIYHLMDEI